MAIWVLVVRGSRIMELGWRVMYEAGLFDASGLFTHYKHGIYA